jgi:hypothetical protein
MRAKFINEKFTEKSDPIEDMGIGIPELRELRKSYKEFEKFLKFEGDLDFDEVIDTLNHLKTIIPYYVIYYLNEKYKLNLKVIEDTYGIFKYPRIYGGEVFAKGKFGIEISLSNSGLSVKMNIRNQSTPQCKSIHRLEAAFLKICKKENIKL